MGVYIGHCRFPVMISPFKKFKFLRLIIPCYIFDIVIKSLISSLIRSCNEIFITGR